MRIEYFHGNFTGDNDDHLIFSIDTDWLESGKATDPISLVCTVTNDAQPIVPLLVDLVKRKLMQSYDFSVHSFTTGTIDGSYYFTITTTVGKVQTMLSSNQLAALDQQPTQVSMHYGQPMNLFHIKCHEALAQQLHTDACSSSSSSASILGALEQHPLARGFNPVVTDEMTDEEFEKLTQFVIQESLKQASRDSQRASGASSSSSASSISYCAQQEGSNFTLVEAGSLMRVTKPLLLDSNLYHDLASLMIDLDQYLSAEQKTMITRFTTQDSIIDPTELEQIYSIAKKHVGEDQADLLISTCAGAFMRGKQLPISTVSQPTYEYKPRPRSTSFGGFGSRFTQRRGSVSFDQEWVQQFGAEQSASSSQYTDAELTEEEMIEQAVRLSLQELQNISGYHSSSYVPSANPGAQHTGGTFASSVPEVHPYEEIPEFDESKSCSLRPNKQEPD